LEAAAKIIDGKLAAQALRARIAEEVRDMRSSAGFVPGLDVVLVGTNPASEVYVRSKEKQASEAGMNSRVHRLPAETSQADLLALVARLNADPAIHGILVQLPLPPQIDEEAVLELIDPAKDVDGFHPSSVGALVTGQPCLLPCTPMGIVMLLKARLGSLEGLHAVVVGRSNIVGKPVAHLLLRESCTVTIAHSKTRDLAAECRRADILVAAVGRPEMIRGDWVKPGATIIDVGINRVSLPEGKSEIVGDVHFDSCAAVAGAITPVPGGVGPMTIACLLLNTLQAAKRAHGLPEP